MANGNLNRIDQGCLVCKINDVEHDSRELLLRHENLVIRVVQNHG